MSRTYLRVNNNLNFQDPEELFDFIISDAKCKKALDHFPMTHEDVMTVLEYLSDNDKLDFAGMGAMFGLYNQCMEKMSKLSDIVDELEDVIENIIIKKELH